MNRVRPKLVILDLLPGREELCWLALEAIKAFCDARNPVLVCPGGGWLLADREQFLGLQGCMCGPKASSSKTCSGRSSLRSLPDGPVCVPRTEIVVAVVQCGGYICVARRTELVGTSQGLWSVVMGYVEPGVEPIEQAWTEVQEELGLQRPDVRLVRNGPSLALTSSASGKQFLVYPFLFESAKSTEVTLNWEHSEVAWVEPSRLADADCVPWQRDVVAALLA